MSNKTRMKESAGSTAFLVASDLLAVWILPIFLALLCLPGVWVCVGMLQMKFPNIAELVLLYSAPVVCMVWSIVHSIGMNTPHLRETPGAMWTYARRFVCLTAGCELMVTGIYCLLVWLLRMLLSDGAVLALGILFFTIVCFLGASYAFQQWAVRIFLYTPLPEEERDLIRGTDLQSEIQVAERAWLDD